MQALTEIARILQPAGVFGGIWNMDDCLFSPDPSPGAAPRLLMLKQTTLP